VTVTVQADGKLAILINDLANEYSMLETEDQDDLIARVREAME
jgi:hypothetical protein